MVLVVRTTLLRAMMEHDEVTPQILAGALLRLPERGEALIQDDYLHGTCKEGGTLGVGTIFRMHMDGTGFQKLLDQTGANGQNALAGLISDGTWLYGTTSYGGQYNFGTVYRIMPDGSGQQLLHEFNGTDGNQPCNELLLVGDTLYGTTSVGGPLSWGTVFKVNKDGTGYTVLHGFGDLPDGRFPEATLYAIGDQLYGISNIGGINLSGFIYRIGMDGTGFTKVFEFTPATTGSDIRCSFIYDVTWFYASGTIADPQNQVTGTLFRVKPDGTDFTMLYGMMELEGRSPRDQVLMLGGYLYSAASMGGINGAGSFRPQPWLPDRSPADQNLGTPAPSGSAAISTASCGTVGTLPTPSTTST